MRLIDFSAQASPGDSCQIKFVLNKTEYFLFGKTFPKCVFQNVHGWFTTSVGMLRQKTEHGDEKSSKNNENKDKNVNVVLKLCRKWCTSLACGTHVYRLLSNVREHIKSPAPLVGRSSLWITIYISLEEPERLSANSLCQETQEWGRARMWAAIPVCGASLTIFTSQN